MEPNQIDEEKRLIKWSRTYIRYHDKEMPRKLCDNIFEKQKKV